MVPSIKRSLSNIPIRNGKHSYDLLNRDLIKYAHSSRIVRSLIEEGVSTKKIRTYIICYYSFVIL